MGEHAKLSLSASGMWSTCTASLKHQKDSTNIYAARGTCAHALGALKLTKPETDIEKYLGKTKKVDGFDIEIDEDMISDVAGYVDCVNFFAEGGGKIYVEHLVKLNSDMWGTADAVIVHPSRVTVVDLKTGRIDVPIHDNTQLILYMLAALKTFGLDKDKYEKEVVIYQPPSYVPMKSVELSNDYLKAFVNDVLTPAYKEIKSGNTQYRPSEKACEWCGFNGCAARAESMFSSVPAIREGNPAPAPVNMTTEQLEHIATVEADLMSFVKNAKTELLDRLMRGETSEKFVVGESTKHVAFRDKQAIKALVGERAFGKKLLTPGQILKEFKNDEKMLVKIQELIYKPEGEPCLKKKTANVREYTPADAETIFANV